MIAERITLVNPVRARRRVVCRRSPVRGRCSGCASAWRGGGEAALGAGVQGTLEDEGGAVRITGSDGAGITNAHGTFESIELDQTIQDPNFLVSLVRD